MGLVARQSVVFRDKLTCKVHRQTSWRDTEGEPGSSGCICKCVLLFTSKFGVSFKLNDEPSVLPDVDPDDLQPGREDAVGLDACKQETNIIKPITS